MWLINIVIIKRKILSKIYIIVLSIVCQLIKPKKCNSKHGKVFSKRNEGSFFFTFCLCGFKNWLPYKNLIDKIKREKTVQIANIKKGGK